MKVVYLTYRELNTHANPRIHNINEIFETISGFSTARMINIRHLGGDGTFRQALFQGRMFLNILKSIATGSPLQTHLFDSARRRRLLHKMLESYEPDLIIFDTYRMFYYSKGLRCVKVLDQDDLFSRRYELMLGAEFDELNVADNLPFPSIVRGLINRFARLILKYELSALRKFECTLHRSFDRVVFVSKKEADHLNSIIGENLAVGIPQFIDQRFFDDELKPSIPTSVKERVNVYFIGNYSIPHNLTSLKHLIKNVLPRILVDNSNISFIVVGPNLPISVQNELSDLQNVFYKGFVEAYQEELENVDILLSPILFGSGIKTKIIEVMMKSKAVISNDIGLEGIPVVDGVSCIVANSDSEMISAVSTLANDSDLRERLGRNGKKSIENHFHPLQLQDRWKSLILGFSSST